MFSKKPPADSLSHVWLFVTPWTYSSVHGILQARILEWVAMPSSRGYSQPRDWTWVSHIAGRFFTIWGTSVCLVAQSCPTFCYPMDCSPPGSSVCRDSPGRNTGVDYHALLQGILPTQGSNPGLSHCRWIPYHLSHQGSPSLISLGIIWKLRHSVI